MIYRGTRSSPGQQASTVGPLSCPASPERAVPHRARPHQRSAAGSFRSSRTPGVSITSVATLENAGRGSVVPWLCLSGFQQPIPSLDAGFNLRQPGPELFSLVLQSFELSFRELLVLFEKDVRDLLRVVPFGRRMVGTDGDRRRAPVIFELTEGARSCAAFRLGTDRESVGPGSGNCGATSAPIVSVFAGNGTGLGASASGGDGSAPESMVAAHSEQGSERWNARRPPDQKQATDNAEKSQLGPNFRDGRHDAPPLHAS